MKNEGIYLPFSELPNYTEEKILKSERQERGNMKTS